MGRAGQRGRGGQQHRLRRWRWVPSIGRWSEPKLWVTQKMSRRSFTAYSSSLCLGQIYCTDIYVWLHSRVHTFMATKSLFFWFLNSPQDSYIFRLFHVGFARGPCKGSSTEGSSDQEMTCVNCVHPCSCIVINPFAQSLPAIATKCWTRCCQQSPKSLFWSSSMVVRRLSPWQCG